MEDASRDDVTLIMEVLLDIRGGVERIVNLLEGDDGEEEEVEEDA